MAPSQTYEFYHTVTGVSVISRDLELLLCLAFEALVHSRHHKLLYGVTGFIYIQLIDRLSDT